jgi:hypothetical protein
MHNGVYMAWKPLSLHFRQTYEGGYRYLDKCGEFMVQAAQRLNFVPGDIKPTGAKMEIPEKGLTATCDSNDLTLFQEIPDEDYSYFVNLCKKTANLALEQFQPVSILKNGFALKEYWAFSQFKEMFAASLNLNGDYQNEIGKAIGMVPDHKKLDFMFSSGSKELHVVVQPVTFEKILMSKHNVGAQIGKDAKSRIERRNEFAERVNKSFTPSHALVLELDLMENNPPSDVSLEKHFADLTEKSDLVKKLLIVK